MQFAELRVKVPAAAIEEERDVFEIWDINATAMRVFLDMATQWRVTVLATMDRALLKRTGLDYVALEGVMRLRRVKKRSRVFDQVRVLEQAALEAFDEAVA